jgi:hypothetical protein
MWTLVGLVKLFDGFNRWKKLKMGEVWGLNVTFCRRFLKINFEIAKMNLKFVVRIFIVRTMYCSLSAQFFAIITSKPNQLHFPSKGFNKN